LIVYFSLGDSIVEVLAPKKEVRRWNSEPTKSSTSSTSSVKRVTTANPDPKPVPTISDLEKLLRKSKSIQGQSSSYVSKAVPKKLFPVIEKKIIPLSKESIFVTKEKVVDEKIPF